MWEKLKQLARRYDEVGELLEVPEIYTRSIVGSVRCV